MRTFVSYGPVDVDAHYYAPRTDLIDFAYHQLLGENPERGGHYITVWAPRQTGKTWVMKQVIARFKTLDQYDVALLSMQSAKSKTTTEGVLNTLTTQLSKWFQRDFPTITEWEEIADLFSPPYFSRPVILILDEFDALAESFINQFANEFRTIYTNRNNEEDRKSGEKSCLLHSLALIGVRAVLGIENVTGSPFNIQRSVQIPNLTYEEVNGMVQWYSQECGQLVEQAVIDALFAETRGQPGLVGWLGELLTVTYNQAPTRPLDMAYFDEVYAAAVKVLPNNNILNIISKAKQPDYKPVVLELFKTQTKMLFRFDDPKLNYLYTNGVIAYEKEGRLEYYTRFSSLLVQKRLFTYFARELFPELGRVYAPFDDLSDTISEQSLQVRNLLRRYEAYLQANREWLLKNAPRRATDLRIFEAVYHFNLYLYLMRFVESYASQVFPEFPTGNGKVDLLIRHAGQLYALEVKSFGGQREYTLALGQAARYARQLQQSTITLVMFIDVVDDENRRKYEVIYTDPATGVTVEPVFVATGS
ncbi:MAG: AAA-like domain-containing protein [Caldilineaceae bacterium]